MAGQFNTQLHPHGQGGKFASTGGKKKQKYPPKEARAIPNDGTDNAEPPFPVETGLDWMVESVQKMEQRTGKNFTQLIEGAPMARVPLESLVATQHYLDSDLAHEFEQGLSPSEVNGDPSPEPLVLNYKGKNYIKDGHHRLTGEYLTGKNSFNVKFLKLS